MKIVITGSLGNIGRSLTEQLVKAGHHATVISSSENKKEAIQTIGAHAAIGSIMNEAFLTETFKGADVIYTMIPDNLQVSDYTNYITQIAQTYANALTAAGVSKLVNLSSNGAHLKEGAGPISSMFYDEAIFNNIEGLVVKHLRPASFYINYYNSIPLIRNTGMMGSNYPGTTKLLLTHPLDIADAAFEEITGPFSSNKIRFIASDEKTGTEVAHILGNAIGKPDLKWVQFTNEQFIGGLLQSGHLSKHAAEGLAEMGIALGNGRITEEFYKNKPVLGKRKFEEFAIEFAKVYNQA